MKQTYLFNLSVLLICILALCACGIVEMGGTMMKKTGEVMEDYSEDHDGIIGKTAGLGGKIHTSVGTTVEDMSQKNSQENSEKSKAEQLSVANKKVINSAVDSMKEENTSEKSIVLKAQKRLQKLGFDPGPADGIMGNKTRQAIGKYQQSKHLKVTKALDEQTLISLNLHPTE